MRHRKSGKHLGRTSAHRRALRRNLAASLFEHSTISTTIEKAKFVRPFAEKLITLAKNGSLHARRRAITLLQNRDICKIEDGEPVKVTTVIQKLFDEVGPRFADRNGGYTRIVRMPLRRIGDNGQLALLQLVGELKVTEKKAPVPKSMTKTPVESVEPAADETPEKPAADEVPGEAPVDVERAGDDKPVSDETPAEVETDKQDSPDKKE
ncbi:MAG: 50S ribosomal protein L17 [Sedimentisphaerales bacterium]|nr:50S ribosomal protein L17 [Sedimentisphaerales bacterium]